MRNKLKVLGRRGNSSLRIYAVFAVLLLLPLAMTGCLQKGDPVSSAPPERGSFMEILGVSEKTEIELVFFGESVPLQEDLARDFWKVLEEATAERTNEERYTPSEYGVRFITPERAKEVVFYWFSGFTSDELVEGAIDTYNVKKTYVDDRFDAVIDGIRYSCRFASGSFWDEENMRSIYDKSAKALERPVRAQILGVERCETVYPYLPESVPAMEETLRSADQVVLARALMPCEGGSSRLAGRWGGPFSESYLMLFQVVEDMKGSMPFSYFLLPKASGFDLGRDLWEILPAPQFPPFQEGEVYLLCLQNAPYADGLPYFSIASAQDSALCAGETLYPSFNTEHHAFLGHKTEEVRGFLSAEGLRASEESSMAVSAPDPAGAVIMEDPVWTGSAPVREVERLSAEECRSKGWTEVSGIYLGSANRGFSKYLDEDIHDYGYDVFWLPEKSRQGEERLVMVKRVYGARITADGKLACAKPPEEAAPLIRGESYTFFVRGEKEIIESGTNDYVIEKEAYLLAHPLYFPSADE